MSGTNFVQTHQPLQLGDSAEDSITGFRGLIISYLQKLHGENEYCLQPEMLVDGEPAKAIWFDESRVISPRARQRISVTKQNT